MTKWSLRKQADQSGSMFTSLSNAHHEVVVKNQNYIKGLIDILLFLARQAFRGHDESDTSLNQGKTIN